MTVCPLCGGEPICQGLGVVRYDVPVGHPNFGKLFRCPNNPVESDLDRQERLRRHSNLEAYADKLFENFTINPVGLTPAQEMSLQQALRVSMAFAQEPDGWLLLEGPFGCGKTHLAAAVGHSRLHHGDQVLFVTVPDLLDHLRSTYGPSSEVGYDELFDRVRNAKLLILDDLGAENSSSWAQEKLFQLFNYRYARRLPTVITTNADLSTLDPRLHSRLLDSNLVHRAKITAPDYRTWSQKPRENVSNLHRYRRMTFDTFELNRNATPEEQANLKRAHEVAQRYAERLQGWLVLAGPYGCGKTHLAAAIGHYQEQQGKDVIFVTVPDLMDYLRFTFSPNAPVTFDQRFQAVRDVSLLILDDLGTENTSAWAREKLFQIIDYRYVAELPTVITTSRLLDVSGEGEGRANDSPPRSIDERIVSRLIDRRLCTIFAITARSYALRAHRRG